MVDPAARLRGGRGRRRALRCVARGAARGACAEAAGWSAATVRARRSRGATCSASVFDGPWGNDSRVVDGTPLREPRGRHRARAHRARPRQGGLRRRPAQRARRCACPVDEAGRFTAGAEPFVGRSVLEVNDDIIAWLREPGACSRRRALHAQLPALLALPPAGDLPRHQAVVHDHRPRRPPRQRALELIENDVRWDPPRLAATASASPCACVPTGACRASAPGASASRRSTARRAARRSLDARRDGARRGADARARLRRLVRAAGRALPAAGLRVPEVRPAAGRSARRPTSSTCGSTRARRTARCQATHPGASREAWARARATRRDRSSTSRVPTSTAAGSTRR